MYECIYLGRYDSFMYLLLSSFYRPRWWKHQSNKSVNSKVKILVGSGATIGKSESSQGHPCLTQGHGGQTSRSKWHSRRQRVKTRSESVPNTPVCSVVFSKADISKRTPRGTSWMWKHEPILVSLIFCFIPSFHAVIAKNWQLNSIDSEYSGSIWPPTLELRRP